jgi:hypothetical protein
MNDGNLQNDVMIEPDVNGEKLRENLQNDAMNDETTDGNLQNDVMNGEIYANGEKRRDPFQIYEKNGENDGNEIIREVRQLHKHRNQGHHPAIYNHWNVGLEENDRNLA